MKNADSSAFPSAPRQNYEESLIVGGLTKREHFAGLAMQNLQNVLLRKSGHEMLSRLAQELKISDSEVIIAKGAVKQADALLKALEESDD